jgi:transcription elongation factor Elf1
MMDAKRKEEYAKRLQATFGECPKCGHTELDASDYDGDRTLSCKVKCATCGLEWTELYRFERAVNFEENNDN